MDNTPLTRETRSKRRHLPSSLRARLLALIGLLCLPLFALLWHAQTLGYRRETLDMEQDVLRLLEVAAGNVEQRLDSTRQLLMAVTAMYHLTDPAAYETHLDALSKGWPFVAWFGVATANGDILCATTPETAALEWQDTSLLQQALRSDGLVVGSLHVNAVGEKDMLSVAYRVPPGASATATVVGFAMLDLSWIDHLEKLTGNMAISRKDAIISVIDSRGVVLGRFPDNEHWMGQDVGQSALFQAILATPGGTADVADVDGRERFHAFTRIKGISTAIYANVGLLRHTALAEAGSARRAVLAGFVMTVALLAVAAWYGTDVLLVQPVEKLAATARLLRARESGARAGLQGGPRELVELSLAFDEMAGSIQEYESQLRETTLALSLSEEKERRKIADDLHEHVGPLLATCYMRLGRVAKLNDSAKAADMLQDMRQLLDQAITHTQELTFNLCSPTLHTLGLNPALDQLCQEYRTEHGVQVVFRTDGANERLSDSQSVVLYQAARELLRNVVKHARATRVIVRSFRDENEMGVEVIDDGVGFNATDVGRRCGKSGGFGLFNLRERFTHLGGCFRVNSTVGKGSRASVSIRVAVPPRHTLGATA